MQKRTLIALLTMLFGFGGLRSDSTTPGTDFFERKIRPLFAEHCVSCHGPDKQKGKLRLDSVTGIRTGGENGPIFVAGDPGQSRIILAVGHQNEDLKMPPKKPLAARQVADLTEWVRGGAALPATEASTPSATPAGLSAKNRAHWAFQPRVRPVVPNVTSQISRSANPIDAFVDARLAARGIAPNPRANRSVLIRRVYFDLTGLPPTPEEVDAFQRDTSPEAWEKVVDRLLDSPRYGEKWGRHWLDLVRFAESNSYERDGAKPHTWRYRDYVIRSFNADVPYDRFLRQQLAGDEMPQPDDDALIATSFYRLGIWDDEPADRNLARYDALDDIVSTVGQTFLGLTIDCARCHDHKIDPIPQRDYYRILSFFHNINPYKNGGPTDEISLSTGEKALGVTEAGAAGPETFVLLRGNPNTKGAAVEPGFLEVLNPPAPHLPSPAPGSKTTGRRTVLADWITSAENPLTARVMANRVWQHHFGRGIVRSPNNFGLQGDAPTHPELLDWLAQELIDGGWRLKPLHRRILLSETYQRSSAGRPELSTVDPANDLFWRYDLRRLTAEEIRDTILAVSGNLNLKMYGPGIYVDIPKEVQAGQSQPGSGWGTSPADEQSRRSIYIFAKRSLLTPILESFDIAEADRSTAVRFATVQPTQALGMLNGSFILGQAARFAARLKKETGDQPEAQVRRAFSLVLSRAPSADEVTRGTQLLATLAQKNTADPDWPLRCFCLVALNLNELIYLD